MKKNIGFPILLSLLPMLLTGCSAVGEKTASISVVYMATAIVSFLLLVGCCCLIRRKSTWLLVLFSSVFVVNLGYLALSLSGTLEEALLANRLSYLGSVFLPMSMLMIILNVCQLKYRKQLPGILLGTGIAVFLVAASPGYLDIYYKSVTLVFHNGAAALEKVYGPWHKLYLFYLLSYFAATAGCVVYAICKRRINSPLQAAVLAVTVFINMGVWLLEQFVRIDFELLSISYIISELFLLALFLIMQESPARRADLTEETVPGDALPPTAEIPAKQASAEEPPHSDPLFSQCEYFAAQLSRLTPTERIIYDRYLAGKTTKEIMAELNIKENTLKFHNKNLYGKLGVSSRKQLVAIALNVQRDCNS